MRNRSTLFIPVLIGLSACGQPAQTTYEQQLFAFGTLVELTLVGAPEHKARAAAQRVDAMYQRQHRDWHAWQRGQLLDLNKAIAINSENSRAFSTRGQILMLTNKFDEAIKDFDKALQIEPSYADALLFRGNIYMKHLKKYEKAIEDFKKYLTFFPNIQRANAVRQNIEYLRELLGK